MKSNSGIANIFLILGVIIFVIAIPVAVKLVQQNQNLQNRAYEVTGFGSIPCTEIFNAKINYCSTTSTDNNSGVPCSEIDYAISQNCTDIPIPSPSPFPTVVQATPTTIKPITTPLPTLIRTTPTPITKITPKCVTGQTKCIGRFVLTCLNGQWAYKQYCNSGCLNGVCSSSTIKTTPLPTKSSIY